MESTSSSLRNARIGSSEMPLSFLVPRMGILVPFSVVVGMCVGGATGLVWERRWKSSADVYLLPLASGLIAGEAMVAVIAAVFLAAVGG